jgi:Protein of unknown function (DUF3307)
MQMLVRAILALYAAHLLVDFPLQTTAMADEKQNGRWPAYLKHGAILYAIGCVVPAIFISGLIVSLRLYEVVFVLTMAHLVIDWIKSVVTGRRRQNDSSLLFILDQLAHFVTVLIAARFLVESPSLGEVVSKIAILRHMQNRFLLLSVIYIGVVFAGGYLIRSLTKSLAPDKHEVGESIQRLRNAGLYIGWLERFLVLTAVLLRSPATLGLILTAKAIARYPEFKSERFAEYFLIGTLLSLSIAILGGIALLKVFYGAVTLP